MAKTIKSITFSLLPSADKVACVANYVVGSTDDAEFFVSRAMQMTLDKSAQPQLLKFWAEWLAAVKVLEGVK